MYEGFKEERLLIDQREEQCYPLHELAKVIQRECGIKRTPHCLRLWIKNGRGRNGQRVRMDCIPIGGVRHSSLEAYLRFCDELSIAGEE